MHDIKSIRLILFFLCVTIVTPAISQSHSIARVWNEALLHAIRNDLARPTVHARNLFHTSAAMYDAWSVFENQSESYFLGKRVGSYLTEFDGFTTEEPTEQAIEKAISYAAYRLLTHRFQSSPGASKSLKYFDSLMNSLEYNIANGGIDYSSGDPAELGNYIAFHIIKFGEQDGSNEQSNYANKDYKPVNEAILPDEPGNPNITDPNRWQPITLEEFIDQSGNPIPGEAQPFLGAEWGSVVPFALSTKDRSVFTRDGNEFTVYHNPGHPFYIGDTSETHQNYIWGHTLVAVWSNHLNHVDGVMWDISPASFGNTPISAYPETADDYGNFYDLENGGDPGQGYETNPVTGQPYEPQIVPRGDYARVLAEFWADGPDSETPPGHWFTVLNYVSDHPLFEKKFMGEEEVTELEWDIKAYFSLGGAMHDAAISAWGVKGYYDYTRPVSAIRYMADRGQSTDPELPGYDPNGIMLVPGIVEVVLDGDSLAGANNENVGKIKINGWRGPDYIGDPETEEAGVGWILAENWWPYQRPTFVTPPFAGYVSGHSTFSRAAAEVMTLITGDEFFPGGMGEFKAPKNEFLVFEEGPSVDLTLQWATYRDASDQTSLSRIWGGIHPPIDDIPGRLMGIKIGVDAVMEAQKYFSGVITAVDEGLPVAKDLLIYPNPAFNNLTTTVKSNLKGRQPVEIISMEGKSVFSKEIEFFDGEAHFEFNELKTGVYIVRVGAGSSLKTQRLLIVD